MPELVTTTKVNTLPKTNNFVIKFANVNGSGSASANNMFAKAIFRMGIPVSPHNIFPSNIQGLPTWYEVRVSDKNYLGRREGIDLMVAMNEQTIQSDINSVIPGYFPLRKLDFEIGPLIKALNLNFFIRYKPFSKHPFK